MMRLLLLLAAAVIAGGCWAQGWAIDRIAPTATPTAIPTSERPYDPPRILAPEDGAVIVGNFPDFQLESPARAWTIHIIIFSDSGYRQEVIRGVGAGMPGWMNDMYIEATPMPLPPGRYQWYAVGCRETTAGGCGPASDTRTFTISDS